MPDDAVAIRFNVFGGRAHVRLKDASGAVLEDCTSFESNDVRTPVSASRAGRREDPAEWACWVVTVSQSWRYVTSPTRPTGRPEGASWKQAEQLHGAGEQTVGTVLLYGVTVPWFLRKRRQLLCAQVGAALPAFVSIWVFTLVVGGLSAMDTEQSARPAMGKLGTAPSVTAAEPAVQPSTKNADVVFDEERYCESISQAAGGSFVIKRKCLEEERTSREQLSRMTAVPARIQTYCAMIGKTAGGSYQLMEACIGTRPVDRVGARRVFKP